MISLIFPVYNEQDNLKVLYERLSGVISAIEGQKVEIIFVDDCSEDGTAVVLRGLAEKDPRVKVIRFSRNSGSHVAVTAGLNFTKGDCAIIMAADLQDPPEMIPRLLAEWSAGAQIVWAARSQRGDINVVFRFFSKMYYFLINRMTCVRMPMLGVDAFLVDRVVINAFNQVQERNTSIFMTLFWLGFRQKTIFYAKECRHQGRSKWTLSKRIKLFLDTLISYSVLPIRFMGGTGCVLIVWGAVWGGFVFYRFLRWGDPFTGWSGVYVGMLMIGGLLMVMLGIIGEYIWRIYDEVRGRPRYIIESEGSGASAQKLSS